MSERRRPRDPHAEMIERWLDQVLADKKAGRLGRMDFAIPWSISCSFNRESRTAWAAADVYARRAHMDRRTIQRWLPRLVDAGHLERVRDGGGRKVTNEYRPILKNSGAYVPPFTTDKTAAHGAALSAAETVTPGTEKGDSSGPQTSQKGGTRRRPTTEKRPLRTAEPRRAGARGPTSIGVFTLANTFFGTPDDGAADE